MRLASSSAVGLPPPNPSLGGRCQNALGRGFWILVSHGPEMADAAVDGERPPQPPEEDAEHADDVPGAEALFDFAAMRPAGALAKVARHEMFAQPPNIPDVCGFQYRRGFVGGDLEEVSGAVGQPGTWLRP